jgi:predicted Zn-dependent protease
MVPQETPIHSETGQSSMHLMGRLVIIPLLCLMMAVPARAATFLRDADIEHSLNQLAHPILAAAGLSPSSVKIVVIKDSAYNAFIVDRRHIFINSGLLLKMQSAAQLQSVLAHEAAHIANGHITRRHQNALAANTIAGLGMALAAATAVSTGNGDAAAGLGMGINSTAQRLFLSHTRAEEAAADLSALRYMISAGVNPEAFLEVLDIFRGQEMLSAAHQDPYARSHPLTRDRIRAFKARVTALNGLPKPDPKAEYWYARAQGKLSAFLRAPSWTLRRAPKSLTKDIRLMREAAAHHRQPDSKKAIATVNKLVALRPKDAFAHDLRGQILLESRQTKAAVAAFQTAADLAPKNALILGGYGRALLVAGQHKTARSVLEKARARDATNPSLLRDLAMAYAQLGQTGLASVVTAERYALIGRPKDALIHAKRAEGLLPRGSAPWLRAQDVISASKAAVNKRN